MLNRYLEKPLEKDLKKNRQMIFLVGPRQTGKTTLAKKLVGHCKEGINYFNWDNPSHRRIFLTEIAPGKIPLVGPGRERMIFDEIHKYKRWENTLKGLFDHFQPQARWIITGSAGLNVYRKGQDSLLGRHFTYHLWPLTLAEILDIPQKPLSFDEVFNVGKTLNHKIDPKLLNDLLHWSGFPEPYLEKSDTFLTKWRTNRLDRLINQDLAQTENLRHLSMVENLVYLLPSRVGSILSLNSLSQDLEVHFATIKHWITLLERVFYGFRIYPYTKKLGRLIKKEAKFYLYDWTEIEDEPIRFENMMAVHLMKFVDYRNDLGLDELSLHFVRDKEKREVDFLICRKRKPEILIECKSTKKEVSPHIAYFAERLGVKKNYQVIKHEIEPRLSLHKDTTIQIISASQFLEKLV